MSWPADVAACYGVNCPSHGNCARYQACDGNSNQRQVFIAMCGPTYPLYIPIVPVKEKQ